MLTLLSPASDGRASYVIDVQSRKVPQVTGVDGSAVGLKEQRLLIWATLSSLYTEH